MEAVSVEGVSKSFGQVCAVSGLTVEVPAGSIYGFLGPNGAGKTTSIRMIMNILRPDTGRIVVLGNDLVRGPGKDFRHRIGYMPEERGLYPKMKVRALLVYLASLQGIASKEANRVIGEWLEKVGLAHRADKRVQELSKGMQQKIQFVATVLHNPDLLILDEPFSGLDPVNVELLKDVILGMRSQGKTVLFSTHIMEQAERLCDSILLINGGRVVLNGPLDQIRAAHKKDTVEIETMGDGAGFIASLPMVKEMRTSDRAFEVTLHAGIDPQALLAAVAGQVEVRRFEVRGASLHDIFIDTVGENDG